MRKHILVVSIIFSSPAFSGEVVKAKLGDPDGFQELTPTIVKNCKSVIQGTVGSEVRELLERGGEFVLPVTPKFIAIEFKHKENVLYCYSAKAGDFKKFVPVKLVYFTNYRPYGSYEPLKGLSVLY